MFAEHQAANTGQRKAIRARIILESTNLVRKYVAAHVSKREKKFEFDDLESTCTVAVIEEVDRLLAKATKHTNPGSMIIEIIRATIYDPDRDLHSRPTRFYRPQKRASDSEHDALILRLEQQGCSPNYIQSQIEAHGWDRPKVVEVEAPWPDENIRGSDGHFTGERAGFDPGACDQSCEDWHTLIELHEAGILSVNEFTLLDLRSQGFTMAECAQELNCHVATLTNWLAAIKTKILLHTDD
jgi:DNA-binding CsgD family transcriptional regulator